MIAKNGQFAAAEVKRRGKLIAHARDGGRPGDVARRMAREDGHINAAFVAPLAVDDDRHIPVKSRGGHTGEILQHAAVFNLHQAENVGLHRRDHLREIGQLLRITGGGPVHLAARREVIVARIVGVIHGVEQVLDVPGSDHKIGHDDGGRRGGPAEYQQTDENETPEKRISCSGMTTQRHGGSRRGVPGRPARVRVRRETGIPFVHVDSLVRYRRLNV